MFQAAFGRAAELRRPGARDRRLRAHAGLPRRAVRPLPRRRRRRRSPREAQRGLGAVQRQGALRDAATRSTASNPLGTDNRFHNIGVVGAQPGLRGARRRRRSRRSRKDGSSETHRPARARDRPLRARPLPGHARTAPTSAPSRPRSSATSASPGPYMHDGSMQTLWDVMDHYNKGGEANPFLDGGIEPLALTESEIDAARRVHVHAHRRALRRPEQRTSSTRQRARRREAAPVPRRRRSAIAQGAARSRRRVTARQQVSHGATQAMAEVQEHRDQATWRSATRSSRRSRGSTAATSSRCRRPRSARPRRSGVRHAALVPAGRASRTRAGDGRAASASPTSPTRISTSGRSTTASCARSCARSTTSTRIDPQPDFVLYGGDLAQLGQREELELGAQILKNLKAPVRMMVGEHDWFLDMGEKWRELFGEPTLLVRPQGRALRRAEQRRSRRTSGPRAA